MPIEGFFKKKNRIEINYYIEDAHKEIEQFQFLDERLLISIPTT